MTSYKETRSVNVPIKDDNGVTYAWEYGLVETGDYIASLTNPTDAEKEAIKITIQPAHKQGIHKPLERLAQIKPIGRSEIKQGTVIGTLVHDMLDAGISEYVVNELCKEYRQKKGQTFFPDYSEFFHKAKDRMKKYQAIYQAQFPKPEPEALPEHEKTLKQIAVETKKMPWEGFTFDNMPEDVKKELANFCIDFASDHIATVYCRTFGINYEELRKETYPV